MLQTPGFNSGMALSAAMFQPQQPMSLMNSNKLDNSAKENPIGSTAPSQQPQMNTQPIMQQQAQKPQVSSSKGVFDDLLM